MNFAVLQDMLESLINSVMTNDPEKVSDYVNKIRIQNSQLSTRQIAEKIVNDQSFVNGLLGAGTGVTGLIALPVTIPFDLVKAWTIQVFTIQCVAYSYGYNTQTTDLKTDIFLLMSNTSLEALKNFLVREAANHAAAVTETMKKTVVTEVSKLAPKYAAKTVVSLTGKQAANCVMKGLPKHIAKALWKTGGRKVVEKAMQKSLAKAIPVVGAATGFVFDWTSTKTVGRLAIEFYENSGPEMVNRIFNP